MSTRNAKSVRKRFADVFAIFYSKADKCWIAHSLRTDQFGMGDCVVDALADGMKAVDQVVELAKRRRGIQVFQDAPEEIHEIARKSIRLPTELFEIAHKKLYGDWPAALPVDVCPDKHVSFKRTVYEEAVG